MTYHNGLFVWIYFFMSTLSFTLIALWLRYYILPGIDVAYLDIKAELERQIVFSCSSPDLSQPPSRESKSALESDNGGGKSIEYTPGTNDTANHATLGGATLETPDAGPELLGNSLSTISCAAPTIIAEPRNCDLSIDQEKPLGEGDTHSDPIIIKEEPVLSPHIDSTLEDGQIVMCPEDSQSRKATDNNPADRDYYSECDDSERNSNDEWDSNDDDSPLSTGNGNTSVDCSVYITPDPDSKFIYLLFCDNMQLDSDEPAEESELYELCKKATEISIILYIEKQKTFDFFRTDMKDFNRFKESRLYHIIAGRKAKDLLLPMFKGFTIPSFPDLCQLEESYESYIEAAHTKLIHMLSRPLEMNNLYLMPKALDFVSTALLLLILELASWLPSDDQQSIESASEKGFLWGFMLCSGRVSQIEQDIGRGEGQSEDAALQRLCIRSVELAKCIWCFSMYNEGLRKCDFMLKNRNPELYDSLFLLVKHAFALHISEFILAPKHVSGLLNSICLLCINTTADAIKKNQKIDLDDFAKSGLAILQEMPNIGHGCDGLVRKMYKVLLVAAYTIFITVVTNPSVDTEYTSGKIRRLLRDQYFLTAIVEGGSVEMSSNFKNTFPVYKSPRRVLEIRLDDGDSNYVIEMQNGTVYDDAYINWFKFVFKADFLDILKAVLLEYAGHLKASDIACSSTITDIAHSTYMELEEYMRSMASQGP